MDPWKAYLSWFSPRWAMPRERFDARRSGSTSWNGDGFRVVVMHTRHHDGVW